MGTKTVNFRFNETDLQSLEGLAAVLDITRTEVLKRSLAAYGSVVLYAYRNKEWTLSELIKRYGADATIAVFLREDADGNPKVSCRIDTDEPEDVVVSAIFPAPGDRALIYLDIKQAEDSADAERDRLELKLALGAHTGVVPGLYLEPPLSWPPKPGEAIVYRLGDLTPEWPVDTPQRLRSLTAA